MEKLKYSVWFGVVKKILIIIVVVVAAVNIYSMLPDYEAEEAADLLLEQVAGTWISDDGAVKFVFDPRLEKWSDTRRGTVSRYSSSSNKWQIEYFFYGSFNGKKLSLDYADESYCPQDRTESYAVSLDGDELIMSLNDITVTYHRAK